MTTSAVVVHQIPGRVRLSIADKRGDGDYFSSLSRKFSGFDGVHRVKTNPVAGSIVLEYAGGLQELLGRIAAASLFELVESVVGDGEFATLAGDSVHLNLVSGRDI